MRQSPNVSLARANFAGDQRRLLGLRNDKCAIEQPCGDITFLADQNQGHGSLFSLPSATFGDVSVRFQPSSVSIQIPQWVLFWLLFSPALIKAKACMLEVNQNLALIFKLVRGSELGFDSLPLPLPTHTFLVTNLDGSS